MFYQAEMDIELRFGDVIKGFVFTEPQVNEPMLGPESDAKYSIGITAPRFSVVLTPCCSIENKTILLTPLIGLRNTFFGNEYFAEDPTRLNRPVPPQKAVSQYVWENKLSEAERQRRLRERAIYAFDNLFVYKEHPLLPKYTVNTRDGKFQTGYYMIDVANTYKMNCDKIIRNQPAPANVKCLQLSVQTRQELRDKVAYYYGRIPEEDKVLLES